MYIILDTFHIILDYIDITIYQQLSLTSNYIYNFVKKYNKFTVDQHQHSKYFTEKNKRFLKKSHTNLNPQSLQYLIDYKHFDIYKNDMKWIFIFILPDKFNMVIMHKRNYNCFQCLIDNYKFSGLQYNKMIYHLLKSHIISGHRLSAVMYLLNNHHKMEHIIMHILLEPEVVKRLFAINMTTILEILTKVKHNYKYNFDLPNDHHKKQLYILYHNQKNEIIFDMLLGIFNMTHKVFQFHVNGHHYMCDGECEPNFPLKSCCHECYMDRYNCSVHDYTGTKHPKSFIGKIFSLFKKN
jgi:hypothetical protein